MKKFDLNKKAVLLTAFGLLYSSFVFSDEMSVRYHCEEYLSECVDYAAHSETDAALESCASNDAMKGRPGLKITDCKRTSSKKIDNVTIDFRKYKIRYICESADGTTLGGGASFDKAITCDLDHEAHQQ